MLISSDLRSELYNIASYWLTKGSMVPNFNLDRGWRRPPRPVVLACAARPKVTGRPAASALAAAAVAARRVDRGEVGVPPAVAAHAAAAAAAVHDAHRAEADAAATAAAPGQAARQRGALGNDVLGHALKNKIN